MEHENKMYIQEMWKCGICGETYPNISQRMQCEMKCLQKQELEAKKAAEAKKKAEQAVRKKEVDDAFDKAMQLREAYLKDYDTYSYEYSKVSNKLENNEWLNGKSLWHFFM